MLIRLFWPSCLLVCGLLFIATSKAPVFGQDKSGATAREVTGYKDIDLETTSLKLVDADASVYQASFQLEQQCASLLASPFFTHLRQTPIVQKSLVVFNTQWKNRTGRLGQVRATWDNPNIQSLISLLSDFSSDEVFFYADAALPETLLSITQLAREIQVLGIEAQQDPEQIREYLMGIPKEDIDAIDVPTIVMGGKIKDKQAALQKIDELEAIMTIGLQNVPNVSRILDGLNREEDDRGTRLSITLDSAMVPWEEIQTRGNPLVEDMIDKAQELLEDRQISIVIGMLDDYLIFAISESSTDILNLGGSASLFGRDEFAVAASKNKSPILGVAYVSDAMSEISFELNLSDYFSRNLGPLITAAEIELEQKLDSDDDDPDMIEAQLDLLSRIPEDLEWIDDQIAELVPEFKGQTVVTVAKANGIESWSHNRTSSELLESDSSLPILEQLGGNPVAFIAGRREFHPEYFETARLIVRKVHQYLEEAADSGAISEEDTPKFDFVLDSCWPLLVEFADVIEQDFIPATEDGQFAFVWNESKISAKQWLKEMPASDEALPLIELAKIVGVNDREQLISGFDRLYSLADQALELARLMDDEAKIPEGYEIPRPLSDETTAGTKYYYEIPDDCPVPETMAPQAVFGENFAYFSYSQPQADAITKSTPLKNRANFIKQHDSIEGLAYFDYARVFEQLRPWAKYGIFLNRRDVVLPSMEGFPEVRRQDLLDLYGAFEKFGELVTVQSGTDDDGSMIHSRYFESSK